MSTTRVLACAGLALLAACADSATSPETASAPPRVTTRPASVLQVEDGATGPGSVYRLVRPDNWNGSLLIYAHGYVLPTLPVALPPEADQFVALLTQLGIAVAYSSYSENGWVVKDGAQRTHQLLGLFTSRFGRPSRVYLGGASTGGLITIKLAETYPQTYAGVLSACAISAGLPDFFAYQAHARAVFDMLYPNVLPGSAAYLPPGTDIFTGIVALASAAIAANPAPALGMALLDQVPLPGNNPAEIVQSLLNALAGNAQTLSELGSLTNGKPYFDNSTTTYSSAVLPAATLLAINAAVERFSSVPSAVNALAHDYEPSGDLRVPMLMLSNVRDPVVPGFNQASYLAAVTAQGAQGLLVQRTVPTFGHCVFTPAELATAVVDLVTWVEFGIKPAP